MSIQRSKGKKAKVTFHASTLLGCACFKTYDDQAIQMAFPFHFIQLHFLDVIKTETGNSILLMGTF